MNIPKRLFKRIVTTTKDQLTSLGLIVLRIGVSVSMIYLHGLPKLNGYLEGAGNFPDPLGFGAELSLFLATFAELFCSLLLIFGLLTRLAVVPLMITMLVAVFIINSGEALIVKEKGLIFLLIYLFFFLVGAGRYSVDNVFINNKANRINNTGQFPIKL